MAEFVKKSAVRETSDLNVGGDVYEELDAVVAEVMQKAEERARQNDRKTVKGRDV